MNRTFKRILTVLLAGVFVAGIGVCSYRTYTDHRSRLATEEAIRLAASTPAPAEPADTAEPVPTPDMQVIEEPEIPLAPLPGEDKAPVFAEAPVYNDEDFERLKGINLEALREVNSDVVGWIEIPGTPVNFPLLQAEDNSYYLTHTWQKLDCPGGSIFLEQWCSPDFTDFNTIIYGHRLVNENMFGSLKHYAEQEYWSEHPYIYIVTDSGVHRYEIYAAYEAPVTSPTYRLGISSDEGRQTVIDYGLESSVIDTGISPKVHEEIITLSTCTGAGYDSRWVVQARLREAAVDENEESSKGGEPLELCE